MSQQSSYAISHSVRQVLTDYSHWRETNYHTEPALGCGRRETRPGAGWQIEDFQREHSLHKTRHQVYRPLRDQNPAFVVRRTRHAGARLCRYHPLEPGFGVPGRGHPGDDATLLDAAEEPSLHRCHSWQEASCARRAEERRRYRRPQRLGSTIVVETAGVAPPRPFFFTTDRHDPLSLRREFIPVVGGGSGVDGRPPSDLAPIPPSSSCLFC
jgi:hypothetical protein